MKIEHLLANRNRSIVDVFLYRQLQLRKVKDTNDPESAGWLYETQQAFKKTARRFEQALLDIRAANVNESGAEADLRIAGIIDTALSPDVLITELQIEKPE